MTVQRTTRTVWVGGGRSWFTEWAAYRAEAKAVVKAHPSWECTCEPCVCGECVTGWRCGGYTCGAHDQDELRGRLVNRLARMMRSRDRHRASTPTPQETP